MTAAYAETFKVRVVRDVSYLQGANYADDKDKLDLYLPEGRDKAPASGSTRHRRTTCGPTDRRC